MPSGKARNLCRLHTHGHELPVWSRRAEEAAGARSVGHLLGEPSVCSPHRRRQLTFIPPAGSSEARAACSPPKGPFGHKANSETFAGIPCS